MAAISVRKKVVKRAGHAPDTKFVLLRVAGNGRPHTWELSRKALRALADQIEDALDNEEDHRTYDGNNRSQ